MSQSNQTADNRSALTSVNHPKSYDPSEYWRHTFAQPPPTNSEVPMSGPYPPNPTMAQERPAPIKPQPSDGISRIPQYFYPRYNEPPDPYYPPEPAYDNTMNPNYAQPPNPYSPYGQQIPLAHNPYAQDPYYPYPTPYLIPLTNNVRLDPNPPLPPQDQAKSNLLAAHTQDADISRLEVYHFTPKQANPTATAAASSQPIIQYHVYPYPPNNPQSAPPPPPAQYPNPTNSNPWYAAQPLSNVETKARGIQTEGPISKNRGVSPPRSSELEMRTNNNIARLQRVTAFKDPYDLPRERSYHQHNHYDPDRATPLADCRCIDCRREREKILNYRPD